jgi:hypothetical protein
MDLRKIGWEVVNWMHLAQDRDQWRAYEHSVSIKVRKFLDYLSDYSFPNKDCSMELVVPL